jgi:hypothetical protein
MDGQMAIFKDLFKERTFNLSLPNDIGQGVT